MRRPASGGVYVRAGRWGDATSARGGYTVSAGVEIGTVPSIAATAAGLVLAGAAAALGVAIERRTASLLGGD